MGGSKKQTVGYKYYAGVHMALCHGPIDNLTKIRVDEKDLWSGTSTGGAITVDQQNLFGGEGREGGIAGTLDFLTGSSSQGQNSYLVSKLGSLVPAFRGVASVVLRQMYLSMNPYLKTWAFLVSRIHTQQDGSPQWQDSLAQIDVTAYNESGDPVSIPTMNPAHIIRECLTNRLWGMGYAEGDLNDATFLAAATTLKAEKMGMCLLWDTQKSIEDFIKIVLQHIDAVIYVNRRTGKFELKLIRADYDEGSLLVLDPSNIDKIEDFKRSVFGELCNSITVNYWNVYDNKAASLTIQDIALSQEQGGGDINTTVTYEGFVDAETASKAGQRDLRTLSTPLVNCTVFATKVARNLKVGDTFKLTWPDYQMDSVVMRVTGIAYGNGKTRRVRIQCVQDVFSYPEDAFVVRPPGGWVDPNSGTPTEPQQQMAFEAPYFILVRDSGQSQVDSALATNPHVGYVAAAASNPVTVAVNAILHTNDGSGYEDVGTIDFCAGAVLDSAIGFTDTEITIAGGTALDQLASNEFFQIGQELLGIVSRTGDVITVKRGVLDTVPQAHAAGSPVLFWDGYTTLDPTEYVNSDSVDVKITPASGSGVFPIASATPMTVNIAGRAARPFPPANITIDTFYRPSGTLNMPLSVAWNNRNRTLQTGGTLIGYFDAGITKEIGATVTIRLKTTAGIEFYLQEGIDTDTFTITNAMLPGGTSEFVVEMWSVRDGLESLFRQEFQVQITAGIPGDAADFEMDNLSSPPAGSAANFQMEE